MNETSSVAVITGASSGIGLELARQFARIRPEDLVGFDDLLEIVSIG